MRLNREAIAAPDDRAPTFELIHREVDSLLVQYFERSLHPILIDKPFQVPRLTSRPAKKCVIRARGRRIDGSVDQFYEPILSFLKPGRQDVSSVVHSYGSSQEER
jgi:hypothetical protein